jgi:hypothetical protein
LQYLSRLVCQAYHVVLWSHVSKWLALTYGCRFCHMCLLKYLVQFSDKCPLCRTPIPYPYEEFKVNVTLDYISRKFNQRVSFLNSHPSNRNTPESIYKTNLKPKSAICSKDSKTSLQSKTNKVSRIKFHSGLKT